MLKNRLWQRLGYVFLMCIFFLTFEKFANAEQYAILVGIWEYHNKNLQLEAPPNDLELMKSLLSAGDINPENMNILTNPDKEQIQRAFRTFSKRLKPSDSLLFYFSGHGTQIIDKFGTFPGDEAKGRYPDKNDEALLPVDVNLSIPETYLLDDEINALLQEFQTKKITCIIDTCYSGDILREIRLGRAKGAPVAVAPMDAHQQVPSLSRTEDILDEAAEFALLLAAAPYNQVVHELRVPVRNDYLPISAMTYSVYRQAMRLSKLTYRQLLQHIRIDHEEWNLPWLPVLEGPENRLEEFFLEGTSFIQRDEVLNLKTITGRSILLSQSQLISAGGGDFRLGLLHAPRVRHWAIVIGVDAYPPPFQSLKYAADDAKAVKDVFQDAGFMVTLMTPDSLLQPTKENIIRQLEWYGQLEEIDLLTVYLSGHGEDADGTGYFLPMDVTEPLSQSGLSLEELFALLQKTNAEHRFIIVDACRIAPKQRFIAALSRYSEESNIIFTACDSNQWAPEVPQLQHGLFTYFLLKGLAGESEDDRGAATPDGRVTVLGLLDYVTRGLEDWHSHLPAELHLPQQITPRVFYNGRYISLLNNQGVNPMVLNNQRISPIGKAVDEVKRAFGEAIGEVKEGIDEVREEVQWEEKKPYKRIPLAISFVPSLSFSTNVVPTVSINILAGHYAKLDGVEFGGVLNMETEEMRWAQFAGVANIVGGDVKGFQGAGTFNAARGNVNALQASGTVNIAGRNVRVAQLAGAVNIANGDLDGLQASGAANFTGGNVHGCQLTGAINIARGDLNGLQASGTANYISGDVRVGQLAGAINIATGSRFNGMQASGAVNVANNLRGAQFSIVNVAYRVIGTQIGVVNIARNVEGLQLGVVNVSESISGAPIGIFNFVKSSPPRLRFWSSDTAIANVGLRLGNRSVYSLLMAGVQPHEDTVRWAFGLGIGGRIPLTEQFFLNIDAMTQSIHYDWWENDLNYTVLNKLRLGIGWRQSQWFSVVGGVAFNVFVSNERDGSDIAYGMDTVIESGDTTVRLWPGFFLGVQF